MECFLQYLDDLDDLVGMLGLSAERLRNFLIYSVSTVLASGVCVAGIVLAQLHTPTAMATLTVLLVTLLYRSATHPQAYKAAQSTTIS